MNISEFLARHRWLALALVAVTVSAACVPIRQEATWPKLSTINNGQNILLTYNDRIVSVNAEDGVSVKLRTLDGEIKLDDEGRAVVWEFTGPQPAPNQFFSAPTAIDDETLLILTNASKRLFEVNSKRPDIPLDDSEGVELSGQVVANPLLVDDVLYVGEERNLVAIDINDKTERWQFETGQGVWSQPLLIDDVLYFTSLDHNLYALDPETGDELWRLDLEGAAPESPVLYKGRLYVGSFARKIFEISIDGEILNSYETEDWVWGRPAIVDDTLYAADLGGWVYALNITGDGFEEHWKQQVSEDRIRATPLVWDHFVVVGSRDHHVYWLTIEDGLTLEAETMQGEILSDMLLIEPSEFVDIEDPLVVVSTLSDEQRLVAFKLQNAQKAWTYPPN